MLNRIVHFSLQRRGLILALAVLLVAYGVFVSSQVKLDVFPEFVQPQVVVQTEAPGLAAEQVEALVTRPVENALNGVGSLESIRSESIQGLSIITAVFKEGTDIYLARQMLAERLGETGGELPFGVKSPKMSQLTSSTMDLLKFGLSSEKLSPMELRSFVDWSVKPRILSVPGVARVSVFGGEVRQLQIQLDPDRLVAHDLSVDEVLNAARNSTGIRGAGFVETPAQRLTIETRGQMLTPEQMGETVIAQRNGIVTRLKDVATVKYAAEPKFGDALVMGKPAILITMSGQYGANTMEVTEAVEQALEELKPAFAAQGIEYIPALHRPATFITTALHNVEHSLFLGAIFVAIVLYLFLLDLRTAFISFTAIPLSLLAAVIVLDHFGATINTMTLGGFAVAIGVVVDDAIIDVENILRRLRQNLTLPAPRPLFKVVLEASLEVRSAIVYATFVVALVFLPVLTMSGLQGRFFAPLGISFLLAILASLGVALTVTPALCYIILSRTKPHAEPGYLTKLKNLHASLLKATSRHQPVVIGLAVLLVIASLTLLPFFGEEFLPDFREGHFVLQVTATPGTSLPEMTRLGKKISDELLANPHIATVEQQIGRAEMGEDTWGPERSEFHVELKPLSGREQVEAQEEIRQLLENTPGIQSEVLTFLGDRISETMSGETAQVVVSIYGDDLDMLDLKAKEVAQALSSVTGAADVQVKAPPGAPRMVIHLRPDKMTQFGFRPVEVMDAIQTAYQGTTVAQIYEGNKVFDVTVVLQPTDRQDPEGIGSLLLRNQTGQRLPLRELADVELTTRQSTILHDGARRRQTVTCNPRGRDVSSFVNEARQKIASGVKFPAGVYVEYTGAAEEQAQARRELLIHTAITGAGILLLLGLVFGRAGNLILVLANVPFALVGGVFAVFLSGWLGGEGFGTLSIGSLVGFVTLFGISMRNSIMLLAHYEHLVESEGMAWNLDTAIHGAAERLVPILMTALVTGLGLLPLALGAAEAGREIEGPMAIVILGGLATSTILNLVVLPLLVFRYGRFETREEKASA